MLTYCVSAGLGKVDYYPFGMQMPGRQYNSDSYRYGFNGQEKDDEIKGSGNSIDFGARIYDPRVGRWMSVDPLISMFPFVSPFNYADNNPIFYIDEEGKANTVYLVNVSSGDGFKKVDMEEIRMNAEKHFKQAGIENVQVVIWSPLLREAFSTGKMDKSDVVVIIGTESDIINYAKKIGSESAAKEAEGMGSGITIQKASHILGIDIEELGDFNTTLENEAGFVILHETGAHLGGAETGTGGHVSNYPENSAYADANSVKGDVDNGKTLDEISSNKPTNDYAETIKSTLFIDDKPMDNYGSPKVSDGSSSIDEKYGQATPTEPF